MPKMGHLHWHKLSWMISSVQYIFIAKTLRTPIRPVYIIDFRSKNAAKLPA